MNILIEASYTTPNSTSTFLSPNSPNKEERKWVEEKEAERGLRSVKARWKVDKTLILEIQSELERPEKDAMQITWPTTTYAVKMNEVRAQLPELWNKQNRETKAAITIQKNIRGYFVRHLIIETLSDNFIKEANEKAIMIQKSWRMNLAMSKARELAISQVVNIDYDKAEERVSWFMVMANVKMNAKYYAICLKTKKEVLRAVIKVQAFGRMIVTRSKYIKIFIYENTFDSVKWNGKGELVQVIGTFTQPAWKVKLELDYCSFRKLFIKYLDNLEADREYEYSFIIDGIPNNRVYKFIAEDKSLLLSFDIQDSPKRVASNDESPRLVEEKRLSVACPLKQNSVIEKRESNLFDETLTQTTDRDIYDSARTNEKKISSQETLYNSIPEIH
jgi:hypothetical protein